MHSLTDSCFIRLSWDPTPIPFPRRFVVPALWFRFLVLFEWFVSRTGCQTSICTLLTTSVALSILCHQKSALHLLILYRTQYDVLLELQHFTSYWRQTVLRRSSFSLLSIFPQADLGKKSLIRNTKLLAVKILIKFSLSSSPFFFFLSLCLHLHASTSPPPPPNPQSTYPPPSLCSPLPLLLLFVCLFVVYVLALGYFSFIITVFFLPL